MPKDRRSPSVDRCNRVSPYSRNNQDNNNNKKATRRPRTPALWVGNEKEWEETKCPICMDHPHNAVLLLCSSREKGCRPYMCSTSSRHSNCLDQFRKSSMNNGDTLLEETKLVCPLCRGKIDRWIVVNRAREFMDSKVRSCSLGTCDFSGNYSELKNHARREHPNVRPTDVDPESELKWRIMEEDLVRQDMFSMQFEYVDDDDDDFYYDDDDDVDDDDDDGIGIMFGGVSDVNYSIGRERDFGSSPFMFPIGFDSYFTEFDRGTDSSLYWAGDNLFPEFGFSSGPAHTQYVSPVSSRENGLSYSYNSLSTMPRENGPMYTHNMSSTRQRENGPTYTRNMLLAMQRENGPTYTHNRLERSRYYGPFGTNIRLSERPRRYGPSDGHNRLSEGARGYGLTTRSRSNPNRGHGSNSQPSSRNANRAEQISTVVEFHDLSSNRR